MTELKFDKNVPIPTIKPARSKTHWSYAMKIGDSMGNLTKREAESARVLLRLNGGKGTVRSEGKWVYRIWRIE